MMHLHPSFCRRLSANESEASILSPGRFLLLAVGCMLILLLTGCAAQVDTAVTVRSDGAWSGEARWTFAAPLLPEAGWSEQLDLQVQEEAAALLNGLVSYTWSKSTAANGDLVYTFQLEGQDMVSLSQIISNTRAAAEGIGGSARLEVVAPVSAGQIVRVSIPGNLTTGYTWGVVPGELVSLEPVGEVKSAQLSDKLGGLARQTMHFRATQSGQARLSLSYRRPWEAATAPTRVYSIQADGLGMVQLMSAISLPETAAAPPAAPLAAPEEPQAGVQLLPGSYNWCDQGGCTPVKDQGSCGSCWAFGTVAPLESAIKLEDGVTTDLSEQYLVSCNTDGWSCSGGWRAHDYHWWKYSSPETEAGAVLEAAFPYVAWDAPCGGPYSHPYKITNWDYVAGYTVPAPATLKQALYDYGPLSVSVCAGPLWNSYYGGILSTDESYVCSPSLSNHSVTLVGWNDADQTWTIKNSWGPGWGESGYMRIKWGISNVGYAAAYIEYTPSGPMDVHVYVPLAVNHYPPLPYTPTLYDISNPDGDGNYTVGWSTASLADSYSLQEDDNSSFSSPSTRYSGSSTSYNITNQPAGTWYYRVRGCNGYGCGSWSATKSVTVNAQGGWQTIVGSDFEGSFPGPWWVFDNGNYSGEYYWAKRNCRAYAGSYSGWAVGGGAQGANLGCYANYPNDAEAWMVYGPFSLVGATDAEMTFQMWLDSEYEWDWAYWGASINLSDPFQGIWATGSSGGWVPATLDLTDVPTLGDLRGQPEVWVAIVFISDSSVTYAEGFYADNILLHKRTGAEAVPAKGPAPALPPGMRLKEGSLSLTEGRSAGHTLNIDNQTGGQACMQVEDTGLGWACYSPGRALYGSFAAGIYDYCLEACGADECRSGAFPPGDWDLGARCTGEGQLDIRFGRVVN